VLPAAALVVAVTVWPWPSPSGVLLGGALVGGRVALVALGIALVHRANRVINFAQADLGQVPAVLAVLLVLDQRWNWYLALAAGLAAAAVLGFLVEGLLIRRFFRAPRLVLTVATIGVAEVLIGGALFLPRAFGDLQVAPRLDPPFTVRFTLGGVVFGANDVLTMIAVPACFVALGLFLSRSATGIAVRAAAERADRAATLGIPVRRLHSVVWVLAALLAFVATFLRAGAVGLPIGTIGSPTFLVQALAAAVIGRMERLPTIAAAAIGIGVIDQAMTFQPGNDPAFNDAILFVIVAVALLASRARPAARGGEVSTWQAAREVRPVPRELAGLPEVWGGRLLLGALVAGALVSVPTWLPASRVNLAAVVVIFGIVGISLVVLTGWAGQVSLGQVAFVGIGGAVGGALTSGPGWDLSLALLGGGLVGAAVAVVIGYPAIRRRGFTLAVITLAFALATWGYLLNRKFWTWLPTGRLDRGELFGVIDVRSETAYYYLCLAALALVLAAARGLRRSRTGRVLVAIRENELAAAAYGVRPVRTTLAAFAFSGFVAAFAGVLFVHHQNALGVAPFVPQESLKVFSMVVIGGLGSLGGALLGALYVRGATYFLPGEWQYLATGAGMLLVLMLFPGGIGAALAEARDGVLRMVARRRGVHVPALVADRRVEEEHPVPREALQAAVDAAESVETVEVRP
jgi:branched-chain amino acid transport system permease protein